MPVVEWIAIKGNNNTAIGAIGFLGNDAVAVVAFYDDLDGDRSGSVSWGEWLAGNLSPISLKGHAVTEVAMAARFELEVIQRDPGFYQMAGQMFASFGAGLVMDGIYAAYFAPGVATIGGGVATRITTSAVKGFVIKKGLEGAVKKAFNVAVGR